MIHIKNKFDIIANKLIAGIKMELVIFLIIKSYKNEFKDIL